VFTVLVFHIIELIQCIWLLTWIALWSTIHYLFSLLC